MHFSIFIPLFILIKELIECGARTDDLHIALGKVSKAALLQFLLNGSVVARAEKVLHIRLRGLQDQPFFAGHHTGSVIGGQDGKGFVSRNSGR